MGNVAIEKYPDNCAVDIKWDDNDASSLFLSDAYDSLSELTCGENPTDKRNATTNSDQEKVVLDGQAGFENLISLPIDRPSTQVGLTLQPKTWEKATDQEKVEALMKRDDDVRQKLSTLLNRNPSLAGDEAFAALVHGADGYMERAGFTEELNEGKGLNIFPMQDMRNRFDRAGSLKEGMGPFIHVNDELIKHLDKLKETNPGSQELTDLRVRTGLRLATACVYSQNENAQRGAQAVKELTHLMSLEPSLANSSAFLSIADGCQAHNDAQFMKKYRELTRVNN